MFRKFTATAFILVACAAGTWAEEDKAGPNDNKPPEGFVALFNGTDLSGWQGAIAINRRLKLEPAELTEAQALADKKIMPHWSATNGILVNDGLGDNLATTKHFKNFELWIDWKIEPKGDSGIYVRGLPQVQIWDSDTLDPKRFAKDLGKGSGALWNNAKNNLPLKRADKAAGEWNRFRIAMKGDLVSVWLNGEMVVDQVAIDNLFERGKPIPEAGPIELQRHPKQDGKLGKLWFKNIYIKELD